jgi:hypothetical protein
MFPSLKCYSALYDAINLIYLDGLLLGIIILNDHEYLQLYLDILNNNNSIKYIVVNVPLKKLILNKLNIESIFSVHNIHKLYLKKGVFSKVGNNSSIFYRN